MSELSGWENFYVIVGSSAGALIGLQFVVITLIADFPIGKDTEQAGKAFATPTIVHFGAVLLLAAILSAPWTGLGGAAIVLGILGVAGVFYTAIVARRARKQTAYQPEFEDWLFHAMLPFVAYAILAVSGFTVRLHAVAALFSIAVAGLLLLFIGIHNAWDTVTYYVFVKKREQQELQRPSE
jgi:hypothetical protein